MTLEEEQDEAKLHTVEMMRILTEMRKRAEGNPARMTLLRRAMTRILEIEALLYDFWSTYE